MLRLAYTFPEQESVSLGTMKTTATQLILESGLDSMTTPTPVETKPRTVKMDLSR